MCVDVVGCQVYEVSLWDTAGQEDYAHIRPLSYEGVQVILLCVGLDSTDSLDNVEAKWLPEMQQHCKDVPFIIVGTKSDLKAEGKAVVTEAQLKALVDKCGKMCQGYRQCSALSGEGVNEVRCLPALFVPVAELGCVGQRDTTSGQPRHAGDVQFLLLTLSLNPAWSPLPIARETRTRAALRVLVYRFKGQR